MNLDDFGLLGLVGPSLDGRITLGQTDTPPEALDRNDLINPVSDHLYEELVDRFALKSAISGVQLKVVVPVQDKGAIWVAGRIVKAGAMISQS